MFWQIEEDTKNAAVINGDKARRFHQLCSADFNPLRRLAMERGPHEHLSVQTPALCSRPYPKTSFRLPRMLSAQIRTPPRQQLNLQVEIRRLHKKRSPTGRDTNKMESCSFNFVNCYLLSVLPFKAPQLLEVKHYLCSFKILCSPINSRENELKGNVSGNGNCNLIIRMCAMLVVLQKKENIWVLS